AVAGAVELELVGQVLELGLEVGFLGLAELAVVAGVRSGGGPDLAVDDAADDGLHAQGDEGALSGGGGDGLGGGAGRAAHVDDPPAEVGLVEDELGGALDAAAQVQSDEGDADFAVLLGGGESWGLAGLDRVGEGGAGDERLEHDRGELDDVLALAAVEALVLV